MKKNTQGATKRDLLFSELHKLQSDNEVLTSAYNLLFNSKLNDGKISESIEKLNYKFFEVKIKIIDNKIIEIYKQLGLIDQSKKSLF